MLCLTFPFLGWTKWRPVMIHVFLLVVVLKSVQCFFASPRAKFHVQNSEWTEHMKQVHWHCLILDSNQTLLHFLLHFSSVNLMFVAIHFSAVVQTLNILHVHEFFWFWNKFEWAPDRLKTAVNNFTVTCSSHMKRISGYIWYTLYSSDPCAFFSF